MVTKKIYKTLVVVLTMYNTDRRPHNKIEIHGDASGDIVSQIESLEGTVIANRFLIIVIAGQAGYKLVNVDYVGMAKEMAISVEMIFQREEFIVEFSNS